MPIRLPGPDAIRRAIAEKAAEMSATAVEQYLALIGPVEPTEMAGGGEAAWRLAYYQGSREEHAAIERAIGMVQRLSPLVRVDHA